MARKKYRSVLLFLIICLFFPACVKQKKQSDAVATVYQKIENSDSDADRIIQQAAMLIDIPLPLYDACITSQSYIDEKTDTIFLVYISSLSQQELIDFFVCEMERYGWQNTVYFGGAKTLLHFESPGRYCSVCIEKQLKGSFISLYIKRASTDARS